MTLSNYFALSIDPSQALPETYNYGLVLLSYLVAVLGSYAFLQFATRIAELRDAGLRYSWLVIGAIAMGGGIWASTQRAALSQVSQTDRGALRQSGTTMSASAARPASWAAKSLGEHSNPGTRSRGVLAIHFSRPSLC